MKSEMGRIAELKTYFKKYNKSRMYKVHNSRVLSLDWSCDGLLLATGSTDNCISIFNFARDHLKKLCTFHEHRSSVLELCWHPTNANLLSTASADKSVRMWDIRAQNCAANIATKGPNEKITWAPNGQTLAVLDASGVLVTFIDTRTRKITDEKHFSYRLSDISWDHNNDLFLLTKDEGCIPVLSYPDPQLTLFLDGHPSLSVNIEFDPKGNYYAIGNGDASLVIFDAKNYNKLNVIERLIGSVYSMSFSHDGKLVASGSSASNFLVGAGVGSNGRIDVACTETGEQIVDIEVEGTTLTLAFHPKEYLLAYACDDADPHDQRLDSGNLKLWGFI